MELTEHLLAELRKMQAKLDEARDIYDRIVDVPVRSTGPCVYRELLMHSPMMGADEAWTLSGKILPESEELRSRVGSTRTQTEILIDMLDDLIGRTGRLV